MRGVATVNALWKFNIQMQSYTKCFKWLNFKRILKEHWQPWCKACCVLIYTLSVCVCVCMTLSVSSVLCETARLSGVQQLGESPQAEGSTLLTLSPTPGGTNVITALPSASPVCPRPTLSLWIKNKPAEERRARRWTNTIQNRVWVKWNSRADRGKLQSFLHFLLFPSWSHWWNDKNGRKNKKKKKREKTLFALQPHTLRRHGELKNAGNGEQYGQNNGKLQLHCCIKIYFI